MRPTIPADFDNFDLIFGISTKKLCSGRSSYPESPLLQLLEAGCVIHSFAL